MTQKTVSKKMENYYLSGTIYQASHEAMDTLMVNLLGNIKSRPRLYGYDILFESEGTRIFVHTTKNDGRHWSLDGEYRGSHEELNDLLSKIIEGLIEADFNYSIAYVQVDEDGEEIDEEVLLEHPEFSTREIPRYGRD